MSAQIVSLTQHRAARSHPVLSQVEAYWDGLRCGRAAPSRAEVDPRGLSGVLRNCFILERIAPGMARFRVAGQQVSEVLATEAKGMPLSCLFLPHARDILEDALERVFATPSMTRLTVTSPADFKRSRTDGQMLLLPLRCDLGQISRILGCLTITPETAKHPRRFDIEAVNARPIPLGRDVLNRPPADMDAPRRPDDDHAQGPAEVIDLTTRGDRTP